MRNLFLLILFSLVLSTQCSPPKIVSNNNWQSIFNGKNLDGWIPKIRGYPTGENYANTFRVVDNLLTVSYDEGYRSFDQQFGHIFYKEKFSKYRIRVEYRFIGEQAPEGPGWAYRNSGIMLHGQSPESMSLDQDFPISIEAQLLGGNGTEERTTMNLCTPGTHVHMDGKLIEQHCLSSDSQTYHGDQWVTAEALVLGDSLLVHYVNGEEVMRYEKPVVGGGVVNNFEGSEKKDGMALKSGYISLQSESHPIQFRKVEIMRL